MLTKDLLRVSRAGGDYRPQFADESHERLAAQVLGVYQGHVGERRETLQEALTDLERDADDFKLVRGVASLVEREAAFETRAAVPPERARTAAFTAAAERGGAVTEDERAATLDRAADRLGSDADAVEASLYADRDARQVLASVEPRWGPAGLVEQYDLSLAQTALFDATEVRVRSSDPKALVSAVKRLRLLYEIRERDDGRREVVVTGPDSLFRSTRRYGTRFARLLRTVAKTDDWDLEATVDDRGTERTMRLSDEDPIRVPDADPMTDVEFDSGIEADFAARFEALDLDWELTREPEPLEAGARVMIPDFAFDYEFADFRVFFEIMGFWTPEYIEKKLAQLDSVEDVEMLVAVDEDLGVGAEIEARDHRAIPYAGSVRIKDVVDALRRYEDDLVDRNAAALPDEVVPDADVVSLSAVAADHGVGTEALDDAAFPGHEPVGRTLVRPSVLDSLDDRFEAGMSLDDVETVCDEYGLDDASAVLARLGYRIEWEGLGGGTVRERSADQ